MADKYLKGGSLNPAWCDEQDAIAESESIKQAINDLLECMETDVNFEIDLGGGISVSATPNYNSDEILFIEDDYEAKFNFIKRHSDNPEDLKLAREIIGLE